MIYKNQGIWNSYIIINKSNLPKSFKKLIAPLRKSTIDERKTRDYCKIDFQDMPNGLSYYEILHSEEGKITGIKIGNDYNHIWNNIVTFEEVARDVKKTIDNLYNRYKDEILIRSHVDGKYVKEDKLEKYNKLKHKELIRKKNN